MAGRVRRCAHILCSEPLPARSRSDRQFCGPRCKQAARRWRRHNLEAVGIAIAFLWGVEDENVVRCPSCGKRFALGHGHRRDAVYCRPSCRQAAYIARKQVRAGVIERPNVTAPGTRYTPVASENTSAIHDEDMSTR